MSKTVPFSSEASMSVTGIFVLLHSDMMNGDLMLISLTFFPPASSRTALMKDFVSEVWLSSPKSHRTNRSCVGLILFRASSFVRRCFFCFCPMYDSLVSAYEYRGDRLFYAFSNVYGTYENKACRYDYRFTISSRMSETARNAPPAMKRCAVPCFLFFRDWM